jgi:hypothetical protein
VLTDAIPQPFDFTVCIQCCNVLRFDADMNLIASSLEEIPMHSRLPFAKVVTLCKAAPRPKPSTPRVD